VLIVEKNVKFHSNLTRTDLSIAANVGRREEALEEGDIKLTS
jgi:hypothetical protein